MTELQTANDAKYLMGDPSREVWAGLSVRWRLRWYCGENSLTDNGVGTAAKDQPPAEQCKPAPRPPLETLPRNVRRSDGQTIPGRDAAGGNGLPG